MSQSATLYRITLEHFRMIEKMDAKYVKPSELTDAYVTFLGSFMGLEFLLSKGLDKDSQELIAEIFNPVHYIGPTDTNIFGMENDEEEFWEQADSAGYLSIKKVKRINALLSSINESKVAEHYNADELNENMIYPLCWHNDDAADKAFNKRQIMEDFHTLQKFFQASAENENYVLSYVG